MTKHHSVIILNGHRYNAKTGESLSRSGVRATTAKKSVRHTPPATDQPHHHRTVRHTAGHIKPHAPARPHTLMRQSVKRPQASAKRRIRVQPQLGGHTQPVIVGGEIHAARRAAKPSSRRLINHFSPSLFIITETPLSAAAKKPSRQRVTVMHTPSPQPRSTAELLEYAVQYADVPSQMEWPASRKHRSRRTAKRRHAHAIGAHA